MIKQLDPLPEFLVSRYKNWESTSFLDNIDKFEKLELYGQKPSSMVISCCDSRVHPTSIFGAEEGEFFIHRNIANLVPSYTLANKDCGTSAAIEYAIKELKVRHLIILGHTDCGGIKNGYKFHSKNINLKYEFINNWLNNLSTVFKNVSKDIPEKKQIQQLEEESIKNSINNLFTFPYVKLSVKNKNLLIHGLIHNISSGKLKYLNPITEKFENI